METGQVTMLKTLYPQQEFSRSATLTKEKFKRSYSKGKTEKNEKDKTKN